MKSFVCNFLNCDEQECPISSCGRGTRSDPDAHKCVVDEDIQRQKIHEEIDRMFRVVDIFKHSNNAYAADVGQYQSAKLSHDKDHTCYPFTPDQCDAVPGCVQMPEGLRMTGEEARCASVGHAELVRNVNIVMPDALEDSALNKMKDLVMAGTTVAEDSTLEYSQLASSKMRAFCSDAAAALTAMQPTGQEVHGVCALESCRLITGIRELCEDPPATAAAIQSALDAPPPKRCLCLFVFIFLGHSSAGRQPKIISWQVPR